MSTPTIHLPRQARPVERSPAHGGPTGHRGVEAAIWDDGSGEACDLYGLPGLCGPVPTYPGRPWFL